MCESCTRHTSHHRTTKCTQLAVKPTNRSRIAHLTAVTKRRHETRALVDYVHTMTPLPEVPAFQEGTVTVHFVFRERLQRISTTLDVSRITVLCFAWLSTFKIKNVRRFKTSIRYPFIIAGAGVVEFEGIKYGVIRTLNEMAIPNLHRSSIFTVVRRILSNRVHGHSTSKALEICQYMEKTHGDDKFDKCR